MSCVDALRAHQEAAPPKPDRADCEPVKDTIEFQLGYRLGWQHAAEDAVEIAEEAETD